MLRHCKKLRQFGFDFRSLLQRLPVLLAKISSLCLIGVGYTPEDSILQDSSYYGPVSIPPILNRYLHPKAAAIHQYFHRERPKHNPLVLAPEDGGYQPIIEQRVRQVQWDAFGAVNEETSDFPGGNPDRYQFGLFPDLSVEVETPRNWLEGASSALGLGFKIKVLFQMDPVPQAAYNMAKG